MFPRRDLNYVEKPIIVEFDKDGKNKDDFFCASGAIDGKDFANNYAGWPRSDLAIINEQTDINVAKAMVERLQQFDVKPANVNVPDELVVNSVRSKYCQAPAEQAKFIERCLAERDAKIAYYKQLKAAKESEKIVFNEPDKE